MLSKVGKIFFRVASISRSKGDLVPTIFLDILDASTGKFIGQMRFNKDEKYSSSNIRMAFNVLDPNDIYPISQEKCDLLEDIIIGGFIWLSMDNHHLVPKDVFPYMVVHNYKEDNLLMQPINAKILDILKSLGCSDEASVYVFDPQKGGKKLSEFLKRRQN